MWSNMRKQQHEGEQKEGSEAHLIDKDVEDLLAVSNSDEIKLNLTPSGEEEDDDDHEYVPESLRSFVKQAKNTLKESQAGFLSSVSPSRPLSSTDGGDEAPFMSPDLLRTPPPNPATSISDTQVKRKALESPAVVSDDDIATPLVVPGETVDLLSFGSSPTANTVPADTHSPNADTLSVPTGDTVPSEDIATLDLLSDEPLLAVGSTASASSQQGSVEKPIELIDMTDQPQQEPIELIDVTDQPQQLVIPVNSATISSPINIDEVEKVNKPPRKEKATVNVDAKEREEETTEEAAPTTDSPMKEDDEFPAELPQLRSPPFPEQKRDKDDEAKAVEENEIVSGVPSETDNDSVPTSEPTPQKSSLAKLAKERQEETPQPAPEPKLEESKPPLTKEKAPKPEVTPKESHVKVAEERTITTPTSTSNGPLDVSKTSVLEVAHLGEVDETKESPQRVKPSPLKKSELAPAPSSETSEQTKETPVQQKKASFFGGLAASLTSSAAASSTTKKGFLGSFTAGSPAPAPVAESKAAPTPSSQSSRPNTVESKAEEPSVSPLTQATALHSPTNERFSFDTANLKEEAERQPESTPLETSGKEEHSTAKRGNMESPKVSVPPEPIAITSTTKDEESPDAKPTKLFQTKTPGERKPSPSKVVSAASEERREAEERAKRVAAARKAAELNERQREAQMKAAQRVADARKKAAEKDDTQSIIYSKPVEPKPASAIKVSSVKPLGQSHLTTPTAASKGQVFKKEEAPPPKVVKPLESDHLTKPTASFQAHLVPEESKELSPPKVDSVKPLENPHLTEPTKAFKAHLAAERSKEFPVPKVDSVKPLKPDSHFIQPTAAAKAHTSPEEKPKPSPPSKPIETSSRLLKTTAASEVALRRRQSESTSGQAKALERIRQRKLKEQQQQLAKVAAVENLMEQSASKPSVQEGIARARERIRQRKEMERKAAIEKENRRKGNTRVTTPFSPEFATNARYGKSKPVEKKDEPTLAQSANNFSRGLRDDRSVASTVSSKRKPRLTIPQAPKFETSKRHGERVVPPRAKESETTLAQSTDLLRKGLRDDRSVVSTDSSRRRPKLTIPQGPRLTITAKPKVTKEPEKPDDFPDLSLTQSGELFMKGLRSEEPAQKEWKPKLTEPKPPKLHQSTSHRQRPKSSEERELEMMEYFKAHPFRARPFALSQLDSKISVPSKRRQTIAAPTHDRNAERTRNADSITQQESPVSHAEARRTAARRPQTDPRGKVSSNSDNYSDFEFNRSTTPPEPRQSGKSSTGVSVQSASSQESSITFSTHPSPEERAARRLALQEAAERKAEALRKERELQMKKLKTERLQRAIRSSESQRSPIKLPSKDVRPFSLQSSLRHEAFQRQLQEKLAREEAERRKMTQFRARSFHSPPAPERKATTKVSQPSGSFQLASMIRHQKYAEEKKRRLQEEEEARRKEATFKAKPLPKTTYSYKKISPQRGPLSNPLSPDLQSNKRAIERKAFDQQAEEERLAEERRKREIQEQLEAEEAEELREKRNLPVSEGGLIPLARSFLR